MAACLRAWGDREEMEGGEGAQYAGLKGNSKNVRGRSEAVIGERRTKKKNLTDGWFGRGKRKDGEETDWWRLPLTVAWDGEVVCAKAVLDVRQRQGGMS